MLKSSSSNASFKYGGGGGGGAIPMGACQIFEDTLEGTRISFDGPGSNGFLPLRDTNAKSSCHILLAQYPKRNCNSNSNGGHFRFYHPKQYQSSPRRYDEHLIRSLPPPPLPQGTGSKIT